MVIPNENRAKLLAYGPRALGGLRTPEPSHRPLLAVAAVNLAAACAAGWLLQRAWRASSDRKLHAAEALGAGAAILCVSVTLDSAIEHYRGMFKDRVMFVGPTMAVLGVATAAYVAARPLRANDPLPRIAFVAVGVRAVPLYGTDRPGCGSNRLIRVPARSPARIEPHARPDGHDVQNP